MGFNITRPEEKEVEKGTEPLTEEREDGRKRGKIGRGKRVKARRIEREGEKDHGSSRPMVLPRIGKRLVERKTGGLLQLSVGVVMTCLFHSEFLGLHTLLF